MTKLIARRIRDLRVYCEIINLKELGKIQNFDNIKGIILSDYQKLRNFIQKYQKYIQKEIPILGICYGLQLIAKVLVGK